MAATLEHPELISPFSPHQVRSPVMYQTWENLTFFHWAYDAVVMQRLLPKSLEIETCRGAAWVGLVPFVVNHLRPPFLATLPWVGQFPETNVRTYVRDPSGKRGVYFFTLDADRLLAVIAARLGYQLPYRWAQMQVDVDPRCIVYKSVRHIGVGRTDIRVAPGSPLEPGEFDNFLTARFSLFTSIWGKLLVADIEHEPWPLQSATVIKLDQNLIEASGIPTPRGAPIVHFARRVDVRVAGIRFASKKPGSESGS